MGDGLFLRSGLGAQLGPQTVEFLLGGRAIYAKPETRSVQAIEHDDSGWSAFEGALEAEGLVKGWTADDGHFYVREPAGVAGHEGWHRVHGGFMGGRRDGGSAGVLEVEGRPPWPVWIGANALEVGLDLGWRDRSIPDLEGDALLCVHGIRNRHSLTERSSAAEQ